METNDQSPQAQLDGLRRAREEVAARLASPWWVHAGYGTMIALLAAGAAFMPDDSSSWMYAAFIGAWLGLSGAQARRAGLQRRNGWPQGTVGWSMGILTAMMAGIIVALGAESMGRTGIAVAAIVGTGVLVTALSLRWEHAVRERVRNRW
jgi:hypothetical protein